MQVLVHAMDTIIHVTRGCAGRMDSQHQIKTAQTAYAQPGVLPVCHHFQMYLLLIKVVIRGSVSVMVGLAHLGRVCEEDDKTSAPSSLI